VADPIEIVPYSADWKGRFAELGSALRTALGTVALRIDHIGSTAVPGLAAKPIIDVQISVRDFEPLAAFRDPLLRLGFVFRAENPERSKRYFREAPGRPRTHVHVRRAGSWAEQFSLLFRDYLRASPDDASLYASAKHELAQRYRDDRTGYTDAKGPIVWAIMARADRWSQNTGWQPPVSDA
jgi:GrpB-like predicted nucleotidyltransferase (UPF0157 family)